MFTVHTRAGSRPLLVAERFSWGAALFGPLWLALHRAWVAAALAALASFAAGAAPDPWRSAAWFALALLLGFCGEDIRRWSLSLRGFALEDVVVARDADLALLRLLDARPDLLPLSRA